MMVLERLSWAVAVLALLPVAQMAASSDEGSADRWGRRTKAKAEALGFTLDVDTAPKPKKITRPSYPKEAFDHCVQGTVIVLFGIAADGKVVEPEVVQSVEGLDASALKCVAKWRFDPARKAGMPVGTAIVAPLAWRVYACPQGRESEQQKPAKGP